jgi:NADH dehydrogenase
VAGPDRISFGDVVQSVAKILERRAKTMNVPGWMLQPVATLLQRFPSFPLTVDQIRMLSEDNVCEIDRYVKTFHVEPKSFVQALPSLV